MKNIDFKKTPKFAFFQLKGLDHVYCPKIKKIENIDLKQAKICIFLKELDHGFCQKIKTFPYCVLVPNRAIKSVV